VLFAFLPQFNSYHDNIANAGAREGQVVENMGEIKFDFWNCVSFRRAFPLFMIALAAGMPRWPSFERLAATIGVRALQFMKKLREQFFVLLVLVAIPLLLQTSCGSNPSEPAKSAEQSKPLAAPNPACLCQLRWPRATNKPPGRSSLQPTAPRSQLTWETWTEQTCWVNPSSPGCPSGAQPTPRRQSRSAVFTAVVWGLH